MTDVNAVQAKLKESEEKTLRHKTWSTVEVLAVACAINRTRGYTTTSSYSPSSDGSAEKTWNNKELLTYFLVPSLADNNFHLELDVNEQDLEQADAIIKHFRRLTFGVIADDLNDYMNRVFKTTQNDCAKIADFGILASVPAVYEKEVVKKQLIKEIKNTVQGYVADVGSVVILDIRYISSNFIPRISCYAHEAVTSEGYLVNFLNKIQLGTPGTHQKIRAKVKAHSLNYHTKTEETQLNYVKPLDTVLEWQ